MNFYVQRMEELIWQWPVNSNISVINNKNHILSKYKFEMGRYWNGEFEPFSDIPHALVRTVQRTDIGCEAWVANHPAKGNPTMEDFELRTYVGFCEGKGFLTIPEKGQQLEVWDFARQQIDIG